MLFTTEILKEQYKDYANPLDKIKREVDKHNLYRIVRGIYENDITIEPMFFASAILFPSYISFDYALAYYGFIPERVEAITCATFGVKKNKTFTNIFGRFEYTDVPSDVFSIGTTLLNNNKGYGAIIASKEKAICDSLYKWPVIHSVKALKILLFEDKRIDKEEFSKMNFVDLIKIAELYKRTNHRYLIKFIRKEFLHE